MTGVSAWGDDDSDSDLLSSESEDDNFFNHIRQISIAQAPSKGSLVSAGSGTRNASHLKKNRAKGCIKIFSDFAAAKTGEEALKLLEINRKDLNYRRKKSRKTLAKYKSGAALFTTPLVNRNSLVLQGSNFPPILEDDSEYSEDSMGEFLPSLSIGGGDPDEDALPFPFPEQPFELPDQLEGEKIMYLDDEDRKKWWPMVIKTIEKKRNGEILADCPCSELLMGEKWSAELSLKKLFEEQEIVFLNPELAELEKKVNQFRKAFQVIDEKGNNDLSFSDFLNGLKIYGEILASFPEPILKLIFQEMKGEDMYEDDSEDEDEYEDDSEDVDTIEMGDFVEFLLRDEYDNPFYEKFKEEMQKKIPKRNLVKCKYPVDKYVPDTRAIQCRDCHDYVWEACAQKHESRPKDQYCPECFERHWCRQCKNTWQVKPYITDEATEFEEIYCNKCYAERYAHDQKFTFKEFPLPFEIDQTAERPLIIKPSVDLLVQDVVEGSLIKTIDSIRVDHRTPEQVALILNYMRPPFEITFRVFVAKYNALRQCRTFTLVAQLGAYDWDEDDPEEVPEALPDMPLLARENSAFDIEKIKMKTGIESAWSTDVFAPSGRHNSSTVDVNLMQAEISAEFDDISDDFFESDQEDFPTIMSVESSPNLSNKSDPTKTPLTDLDLKSDPTLAEEFIPSRRIGGSVCLTNRDKFSATLEKREKKLKKSHSTYLQKRKLANNRKKSEACLIS